MTMSGGRRVVRALEDEGIAFAFGIPGTHNIELYDALAESEKIRTILVTDEQSASFMADGVWRSSGKMACVNLVPGAGLTHAMSGIAEAFLDNVPMLVLGCGIRRDVPMGYQLHDVDQLAIARPVTKATLRPEHAGALYSTVRKACRIAREGVPGPVMVEIPADFYLLASSGPEEGYASEAVPETLVLEVQAAVEILRKSRRPLLYVGRGAAGADLVRLAETLESPVATTFSGKGVFPESHPLALWPGFGDAAPSFAREVARSCDATLAIGCRFGEVATASYGMEPPKPLIHVDLDPAVPGRNYPAEVKVVSDAVRFVQALLPQLEAKKPDGELRRKIRGGHEEVWRVWESEASGERVSAPLLLRSLQRKFGPETIFTTDSGNGTFLAMESLRLEKPGKYLAPVDYSCMGYAVPSAIGAAMACPGMPVISLAGDGAFLMTGLELLTAAATKTPVAVFVLRDRELAQIAQFQEIALNRKSASVLPDYDLGSLVKGTGAEFLRLETNAAVGAVLEKVAAILRENRPVVVEVEVDYSKKTYFTRGVVKTNLLRLPWRDRLRFVGRALVRKVTG